MNVPVRGPYKGDAVGYLGISDCESLAVRIHIQPIPG